jgi:hypothetical protein
MFREKFRTKVRFQIGNLTILEEFVVQYLFGRGKLCWIFKVIRLFDCHLNVIFFKLPSFCFFQYTDIFFQLIKPHYDCHFVL